jgi:hypothetical protein
MVVRAQAEEDRRAADLKAAGKTQRAHLVRKFSLDRKK